MHQSYPLPAAALTEFSDDGVTVLRGVFSKWVDTLRAGVETNLASPGPHARHYTPAGEPGRFFGDYCNWQRIDEYEEFVRRSPVGAVAAALMGATEVRFFHEHVLVKEPGSEQPTPWHHDHPYYPVDGTKNVSLWIPLDRVPRETCPEFVAGSHRWGKWFLPTRFTGEEWDRDANVESVERIPDIEGNRADYDIRGYALEPGDAIAFNFLTVHGAPPNRSAALRRRGFSARLVGEDATWAERTGQTSPPFPELKGRLQAGDKLDGVDAFPKIYPPRG